jgi:hypothetical protein
MVAKPIPLTIAAGVDISTTEYYAQGRYISCDHIRFVGGLPEKIGGWTQWNNDGDELTTVCRSALCYSDFNYNLWSVFGTSSRLWVFSPEKVRTNITPFILTGTLVNPFSTVASSAIVTVAHAAHGLVVGQYVNFSGASAVGGITVNGEYQVTSVIDANSYRITHTSNASSTAGPGGGAAVGYNYELASGNPNIIVGGGWGLGTWGTGTWGDFRGSSTFIQFPRFWSLDTYGQFLLALPSGGTLYQWSNVVANRAVKVLNSPAIGLFMFVTSERIVVILGADGDNMLMKWCDDDDNTVWTPLATNTANSRRLQEGNRMIAGGRLAQSVNLVWTDTALYLMQFTGQNNVYSTRVVAKDCGLVGPAAFIVVNGTAFWMSSTDFYYYSGSVQRIPNSADIQDLFLDIHENNRVKTACYHNEEFKEIWWHYPSLNAVEPDKYAVLSLRDFSWATGTMDRTAFAQRILNGKTSILGVSLAGKIFEHEVGVNDHDLPLAWSLETSYLDLQDGATSVNIDGYIPDFSRQTGSIDLTFTSRDYPRDTTALETLVTTIAETDSLVDVRHFGRQVKVKLGQSILGGDFALGRQRIEVGMSGNRR